LDEFNASDENLQHGVTQYKEGYRLTTDEKTDEKMRKAAQEAVLSTYKVLGQSCIDVASDALRAGGFKPGESDNYSMNSPIGWFVPNKRYARIKEQNPNGSVVNFINYFPPGIRKKIPEGTVSVDVKDVIITVIPNDPKKSN